MNLSKKQRLFKIDELIRAEKYPDTERLAGILEVSTRTIERDIEYMKTSLKAPIENSPPYRGYYYTEKSYFLPEMVLTEGEIFGLLLADNLLKQYENTPHEERLRSAFMKLQVYLPDKFHLEVSRFRESCSFDLGFVRKVNVELFEGLISAITSRKQLRINYYTISKNEKKWRVIDPYHMKNYRGEWYLAAYCHNSEAIKNFSPIRIHNYDETGEIFTVKKEFSPEEYWGKSFGIYKEGKIKSVIVWIDEYQSRWIKEIVFESDERIEKVENHPDGSMTVTFKAEGLQEIERWIMQYGSHMEVLEPVELRDKIRKEIEGMMGRYGLK